MTDPGLRASDADRERVVSRLHQQVGEGRLTLEEFSERSAAAYTARTLGDLDAVTRDLPAPVAPSPASTPRWLVPMVIVVAVLFLAGGLLAVAGPATADTMHQMMAQMGRMCG